MSQLQSSELQAILTLARQGDPNAIATLINHSLNPKGITARVGWKHHCLGILLEALPVPDQQEMVAFIRQSLVNLQPESIHRVKVGGYQPGQSVPAWYEEFEMEGSAAVSDLLYQAPSLTSWLNQGLQPSDGLRNGTGSATAHSLPPNRSQTVDRLRFLRFYVNAEDTALLPLNSIQQVLKVPATEILPVPHMPDCVLGIYNWRGEMLWLVDVAQQLGFASVLMQSAGRETVTAIVIQTDRKFLGLVVPQLRDIEVHSLQQLHPPTAAFPAKLLSFMQGYFTSSSSPVLKAQAFIQDPLLQVHCQP
jgi:chemotaxis signal transduction protein